METNKVLDLIFNNQESFKDYQHELCAQELNDLAVMIINLCSKNSINIIDVDIHSILKKITALNELGEN